MPTYSAIGVTARLRTCDLKSSLSRIFDWRQGREQKADSERVQELFASARFLPETPIGEDGSEHGVLRFVGAEGDMALYVVEVGDGVGRRGGNEGVSDPLTTNMALKNDAKYRRTLPSLSDDSPLTSIGETPTQQTSQQPPRPSQPARDDKPTKLLADVESSLENYLRSAVNVNNADPQALILDVEICDKTFLSSTPHKMHQSGVIVEPGIAGKDLKLEVFVNGQLADVSLVNARRLAVQIVDQNIVRFSGMRVHRQVEKPWIHVPLHIRSTGDVNDDDVEQRWKAVSVALTQEAAVRGRDRLRYMSPSAEFLASLAGLELPERLRNKIGIGVVDVVVTAGTGKKYGPETAYITSPTRLDDPQYRTSNQTIDPALLSQEPMFPYGRVTGASPQEAESSPEVPLSRQYREIPATPTRRKTIDLTASHLGVSIDDLQMQVAAYKTTHGKVGKGVRTLGQRLGDLKKMNKQNQTRELAKLKEQVSMKGILPTETSRTASGLNALPNAASEEATGSDAVSPPGIMGSQSMPEAADPDAILTQRRIDLALTEGAASNSHLLRRIASSSPQRTPKKKTRASALAGSPTFVPVKSPPARQPPPVTPQKRRRTKPGVDSSPLRFSQALGESTTPASPQQRPHATTPGHSGGSGRGANRTSRSWDPTEQTASEALRAFEVPEGCKGSCVSYAEGEEASRQIGKARAGEFYEDCLLVGMRFVVV